MMESDEEGEVMLVISDLEEIDVEYADANEEEIDLQDLSVDAVLSDDDFATFTASSEGDSSDDETSLPAGVLSVLMVVCRLY